jgi:4-hydroxythreonine-4-phosphate dehydrogenase
MKNRPILIIMGEPYSVFLELIFKVFKSDFITKVKRPIVLIGSKKLLQGQMNILGYKFKVKTMLPAEIKKSIK